MEKAYLKCNKKEGEYLDEYVVSFPLSNGNIHFGNVEKKHFNNEGRLKALIIEDYGKDALVLFPERIGQEEVFKVDTKYLIAA